MKVRPKFIREDIDFENKNRYLGMLIFEKMSAFDISAVIPPFVASLKKAKIIFPQKTYIV